MREKGCKEHSGFELRREGMPGRRTSQWLRNIMLGYLLTTVHSNKGEEENASK
jgi:hypothetical protein